MVADVFQMNKPLAARFIVLIFLVSMLANTFGWSFNSKIFTHELAHLHHGELFLIYPDKHLELHQTLDSTIDWDAATHLCLHAAGQFQPFYLYSALQIVTIATREVMVESVVNAFPESAPDPFFRPPRFFS